jgi:syntaxin 5
MINLTNQFQNIVQEENHKKHSGQSERAPLLLLNGQNKINGAQDVDAFNKASDEIGKGVRRVDKQLAQLTRLVSDANLFDDSSTEINRLTSMLKQDITRLQSHIGRLEALAAHRRQQPNAGQLAQHQRNVVEILRSKLAVATQRFQAILERRTETLRRNQQHRLSVLGVSSQMSRRRNNNSGGNHDGHNIVSSSSSSSVSAASSSGALFDFGNDDDDDGGGGDGALAINMPPAAPAMMMMSQAEMPVYSYSSARADAVETIERTLHELGSMFTQIARQLVLDSERIQRIDANVIDADINIHGAQSELLTYWHNMKQNRWLYIKIFSILVAFVLIFILFFG